MIGVKNERAISAALAAYGGSLPLIDFISLAKKYPVLLRPVQFLQKRLRDHTLGEERWLELSSQASTKLILTTAHATTTTATAATVNSTSVHATTAAVTTTNDNTSLRSSFGGDSVNTSTSSSILPTPTVGLKMTDTGPGLGTQGPGLGLGPGPGLGQGGGKVILGSKSGDTLVVRTISRYLFALSHYPYSSH